MVNKAANGQALLEDHSEVILYNMTLRELSDWVVANNNGLYDEGEFPAVDDLTDEEEAAAREEYESMADDIMNVSAT